MKKFLVTGWAEYYSYVEANSKNEALNIANNKDYKWARTMNLPLQRVDAKECSDVVNGHAVTIEDPTFVKDFKDLIAGYGDGVIPVRDLHGSQNAYRMHNAFHFIHLGWMETALSASGSMLLKVTESGKVVIKQ